MSKEIRRDTPSPSHERAPYSDPLRDGLDPTSPGAPHEPGGEAERQSQRSPGTPLHDKTDWEVQHDRPETD